jgi:hypothetical protein
LSAIISDCGRYRYRLERNTGGPGGFVTAVIMVNPSTADAELDDATIRKLKGFARANRWGRIIVGNLFALRATDVRVLAKVDDPIGPDNDDHLRNIIVEADRVIVAWGPRSKLPPRLRNRYLAVLSMLRRFETKPECIGPPAKDGHPRHPLMLPYSSPILPWTPPV